MENSSCKTVLFRDFKFVFRKKISNFWQAGLTNINYKIFEAGIVHSTVENI